MCIGVVGKVTQLEGSDALIDLDGNRVNVSSMLVPELKINDYVLIHAGFAISIISEDDYEEQKRIFSEIEELARDTFKD